MEIECKECVRNCKKDYDRRKERHPHSRGALLDDRRRKKDYEYNRCLDKCRERRDRHSRPYRPKF